MAPGGAIVIKQAARWTVVRLCAAGEDLTLLKCKEQRDANVGSTGVAMLFVKNAHIMTGSQFANNQLDVSKRNKNFPEATANNMHLLVLWQLDKNINTFVVQYNSTWNSIVIVS